MPRLLALTLALLLGLAAATSPAHAECRMVGDVTSLGGKPNFLKIDPGHAEDLAKIGVDRAMIFAAMVATSIPETEGCWAAPSGNFDGQIVSVGMSQWNYGTGSLQPLLKSWKSRFASPAKFMTARTALMPVHGELVFSDPCLKTVITDACKAALLALQDPATHKLDPVFEAEMIALFQTDLMLQVQTDTFVKLLDSVRLELKRLFPTSGVTPRKIKWAIDTKVQQGSFPEDGDVLRIRQKIAAMAPAERPGRLKALVTWYKGLGESIDQDGIKWDTAWNVQRWNCAIDAGLIDNEMFELAHLTFLRSRVASGNGGRWQALTFQRRAKIVFGLGSVGGRRDGECVPA